LNELTFWDYIGFGKVITMDIKTENKPIAANKKRGNRCVFQEAKI
jgi:hypothetical protein